MTRSTTTSSNAWNPRWRLLACVAPAAVFFAAFWLLPVVRLLALPADKGAATYFAVLTDARYLHSMANTVALSVAVTLATLVLGAAVGIYLARHAFPASGCCCRCSRCRCRSQA